MTTDKNELLQQARDSLAAAKLLLANGYAGYSAARSYYTMFYAERKLTRFKRIVKRMSNTKTFDTMKTDFIRNIH